VITDRCILHRRCDFVASWFIPPNAKQIKPLSKDVLLFLCWLFGLLLNLLGLFLDSFGYLLHDDLFNFLLDLLCLPALVLNGFCHLLLNRFKHLGNKEVAEKVGSGALAGSLCRIVGFSFEVTAPRLHAPSYRAVSLALFR